MLRVCVCVLSCRVLFVLLSLTPAATCCLLLLSPPKEMLLLAGKKAERSTSLASFSTAASGATAGAIRSRDRETPGQKSAIKRLKELQTRRSEMVAERKKVRNYSVAT